MCEGFPSFPCGSRVAYLAAIVVVHLQLLFIAGLGNERDIGEKSKSSLGYGLDPYIFS